MGVFIEQHQRCWKFDSLLGGSEEGTSSLESSRRTLAHLCPLSQFSRTWELAKL